MTSDISPCITTLLAILRAYLCSRRILPFLASSATTSYAACTSLFIGSSAFEDFVFEDPSLTFDFVADFEADADVPVSEDEVATTV